MASPRPASNETQEANTCEGYYTQYPNLNLGNILYATFIADYGLRIFLSSFLAAATSLTGLELASKNRVEPETMKEINRLGKSGMQTLSTGLMIERFTLPPSINPLVKHAFLPLALPPLAREFLRRKLYNYPGQTTYQEYKKAFPNDYKKVLALTGLEGIACGTSLAVGLNLLGSFLIDSFYDSTHANDLPYQFEILLAAAGAGILLGMVSVLDKRLQKAITMTAETLQKFYLTSMPLISIAFCSDPRLENPNTFMKNGVIPLGILAGFSTLLSGLHTYMSQESPNQSLVAAITEQDIEGGNINVIAPVNYASFGPQLFIPAVSSDSDLDPDAEPALQREPRSEKLNAN